MNIDLSIVILLWQGDDRFADHVSAAIRLAKDLPPTAEVVLVDNGSSKVLGARPPATIQIVTTTRNIGVSAGWNAGLFASAGRNICFLNQDARADPEALLLMSRYLDDHPDCGVVGPLGSNWDLSAMRHTEFVRPHSSEALPCDVVSGFCFTVRRYQLVDMGGFDVRLSPCGYEEVDLAFHQRLLGIGGCFALGGLDVDHSFGISSADPWRRVEWLNQSEPVGLIHQRNTEYMRRKYANGSVAIGVQHKEPSSAKIKARYVLAASRRRVAILGRSVGRHIDPHRRLQ